MTLTCSTHPPLAKAKTCWQICNSFLDLHLGRGLQSTSRSYSLLLAVALGLGLQQTPLGSLLLAATSIIQRQSILNHVPRCQPGQVQLRIPVSSPSPCIHPTLPRLPSTLQGSIPLSLQPSLSPNLVIITTTVNCVRSTTIWQQLSQHT